MVAFSKRGPIKLCLCKASINNNEAERTNGFARSALTDVEGL